MNRVRLYLHRIFRRPALTGPMPIYTRRVPDGVYMDLEEYFIHVITTIADNPELLGMLDDIVTDRAISRKHDGWEPEALLLEKLAGEVGYEVPVRGEALTRLAARLIAAAPAPAPAVAIPAQRTEGGAAA